MRPSLLAVILTAVLPFNASAVCTIEPLEQKLIEADVVIIGTVIDSKLVAPLSDTGHGSSLHDQSILIVRHTLTTQVALKGNPAAVDAVFSRTVYNDPANKRIVDFPELVTVNPGDTLLILGRAGEQINVTLCSASRHWDVETSRIVRSVFPSAP
jgi:hypothetical protein